MNNSTQQRIAAASARLQFFGWTKRQIECAFEACNTTGEEADYLESLADRAAEQSRSPAT